MRITDFDGSVSTLPDPEAFRRFSSGTLSMGYRERESLGVSYSSASALTQSGYVRDTDSDPVEIAPYARKQRNHR